MTLSQRFMLGILGALRRVVPQRRPQVDVPRSPDLPIEAALRGHLPFLFSDWGARIVQSQPGEVVIECGSFRLRTISERDFLIFFIAPTAHTGGWENADIAIAAATGGEPLDVRTSLTNLADALEPRVASLQSAFSSQNLARTEQVLARMRDAAEERFRRSFP